MEDLHIALLVSGQVLRMRADSWRCFSLDRCDGGGMLGRKLPCFSGARNEVSCELMPGVSCANLLKN